ESGAAATVQATLAAFAPLAALAALVALPGTMVCGVTRLVRYAMGVILTPTMARTKLLLVLLAVGVYAGTPPVYVFFRVRAASLRREGGGGGGGGKDVLDRQRAVQAAAGEA